MQNWHWIRGTDTSSDHFSFTVRKQKDFEQLQKLVEAYGGKMVNVTAGSSSDAAEAVEELTPPIKKIVEDPLQSVKDTMQAERARTVKAITKAENTVKAGKEAAKTLRLSQKKLIALDIAWKKLG